MKKRYFLWIVEEGIMDPRYSGFAGGRIEVHDADRQFAIDEIRFFLPRRLFEPLREVWDGAELSAKELKNFLLVFRGEEILKEENEQGG